MYSSIGSLQLGSLLISGQVARFQEPSNTLQATPVRITFPVPVSDAQYLTDACSELVLILHAAAIDTYIYYYVLQNVFPTGPVSEAPEYTSVCVLELHFWYLKFARKVLCCDTYLVCFQSLHSKTSLMSAHTTIFHPHSVQFGGWSSQGLRLSGSWENGSTHVVCESTHLTSFAMLVDYSGVVAVSLSSCTASLHAFPPVSHHFNPSIPSTFLPSFITHYHLSPPFLHPSICPFLPPSLPPSFLLAIPPLFPPPYPPIQCLCTAGGRKWNRPILNSYLCGMWHFHTVPSWIHILLPLPKVSCAYRTCSPSPPTQHTVTQTVLYYNCMLCSHCIIHRRELYTNVVHFVHLNFCIALLCGLVVFLTIAPVGLTQSEVRMHTVCMNCVCRNYYIQTHKQRICCSSGSQFTCSIFNYLQVWSCSCLHHLCTIIIINAVDPRGVSYRRQEKLRVYTYNS